MIRLLKGQPVCRILAIAFLATTCFQGFGQKSEYVFLPKWKVGDKKTVSITQHETEYKKGKLEDDKTINLGAEMTVLAEDKESYTLKLLYENVALRSAIDFYDKLGEELSEYKNLELKYRVNKQSGKAELVNWKEAQQFINSSFEQIDAVLKKKVPNMAGFTKLAFAPILEMFQTKENIESYVNSEIGYLLFPYGKKFAVGDTLRITESCANPFNPTEKTNQTTISYLSNIDQSKKLCDINATEIFDLTAFREMMKSMMGKMSKSFGAADSTRNKASKEIDSIDFDVTNKTVITFDYNAGWPTKVIKTAKVVAADPRGKSERTVEATVIIN